MADDTEKKPPLPQREVEVPDYRGYEVDPRTGLALDPFKLRDKRNARTNPPSNSRGILDDRADEFWGLE